VSSSTRKSKLKYDDNRDLILTEEVHIRDSCEAFYSGDVLNLEPRGRGYSRNYGRGKSRSGKKVKVNLDLVTNQNVGTKEEYWKRICKRGDRRSV